MHSVYPSTWLIKSLFSFLLFKLSIFDGVKQAMGFPWIGKELLCMSTWRRPFLGREGEFLYVTHAFSNAQSIGGLSPHLALGTFGFFMKPFYKSLLGFWSLSLQKSVSTLLPAGFLLKMWYVHFAVMQEVLFRLVPLLLFLCALWWPFSILLSSCDLMPDTYFLLHSMNLLILFCLV